MSETKAARLFEGFFPGALPGAEGAAADWALRVFAAPVETQKAVFQGVTAVLARAAHDRAEYLDGLAQAGTPADVMAQTGAYTQKAWRNVVDSGAGFWSPFLTPPKGAGKAGA